MATITSKRLFLSYSPFEIAVSLIKVTRDKFNLNNDNYRIFCDLYQINQNDFSTCILAIKNVLNHKIQSVTPNIDTLKINTRYQITCFNMKPKSNTSLKTIYKLKEEEKNSKIIFISLSFEIFWLSSFICKISFSEYISKFVPVFKINRSFIYFITSHK